MGHLRHLNLANGSEWPVALWSGSGPPFLRWVRMPKLGGDLWVIQPIHLLWIFFCLKQTMFALNQTKSLGLEWRKPDGTSTCLPGPTFRTSAVWLGGLGICEVEPKKCDDLGPKCLIVQAKGHRTRKWRCFLAGRLGLRFKHFTPIPQVQMRFEGTCFEELGLGAHQMMLFEALWWQCLGTSILSASQLKDARGC